MYEIQNSVILNNLKIRCPVRRKVNIIYENLTHQQDKSLVICARQQNAVFTWKQ